MALYQVPCKTMVTLNLSSDYKLDNNTMFQMPHGTIKHIFLLDLLFEKVPFDTWSTVFVSCYSEGIY